MRDTAGEPKFTDAELAELTRLKSYFPFRIVYGAIHPGRRDFISGAVVNMRQPNKLAREGWHVVILGGT